MCTGVGACRCRGEGGLEVCHLKSRGAVIVDQTYWHAALACRLEEEEWVVLVCASGACGQSLLSLRQS